MPHKPSGPQIRYETRIAFQVPDQGDAHSKLPLTGMYTPAGSDLSDEGCPTYLDAFSLGRPPLLAFQIRRACSRQHYASGSATTTALWVLET